MRQLVLHHDNHAQAALRMLDELQLALVGIGTAKVVAPLVSGDNFFTAKQLAFVRSRGAVGEVNLRFIDADGQPVHTELDDLVVGATLKQLRKAPRRVASQAAPASTGRSWPPCGAVGSTAWSPTQAPPST